MSRDSRKIASDSGMSRYFTEHSCQHGHYAERDVTSGYCIVCCKIALGIEVVEEDFREKKKPLAIERSPYGQIISRQDAINSGKGRYFTGVACVHGHIAERTVRKSECIECGKVRKRKEAKKRREKKIPLTERQREWMRNYSARWRALRSKEQIDRDRNNQRVWLDKKRALRNTPEWVAPWTENPDLLDKKRALDCLRASIRRGAVVDSDKKQIDIVNETLHIFRMRRELEDSTGIQHHIDHIIPIFAGGKHNAENLQVLSDREHFKKTQRDKEMYSEIIMSWLVVILSFKGSCFSN